MPVVAGATDRGSRDTRGREEGGAGAPGWGAWAQTLRVRSLAISTIAVAAGGALAYAEGHSSSRLLAAWLGAVSIQAGTNLTNVAFNYKTGQGESFTADPLGSSAPVRAGILAPERVRRGSYVAFGVGSAAGLLLALLCGWPILAIGIPAVLTGYFYGAPPLRLAYRGLGVIAVFVFMGPVMVVGSFYVVALHASPGALLVSVPVGMLAATVMHTNDLRDYADDVAHGKRTLSTMIGWSAALRLLELMVVAAYAIIVAGLIADVIPKLTILTLLSLPAALSLMRSVRNATDRDSLSAAWFRAIDLYARFGSLLIGALIAVGFLSR